MIFAFSVPDCFNRKLFYVSPQCKFFRMFFSYTMTIEFVSFHNHLKKKTSICAKIFVYVNYVTSGAFVQLEACRHYLCHLELDYY